MDCQTDQRTDGPPTVEVVIEMHLDIVSDFIYAQLMVDG